ncbi:MAG: hypothetical protein RMN24_16210 [Anaerolineae bacterium]|nr:hypothetical protein [Caldilineales bacterium]MDW8270704.1 hypothetical protein [Anaerolineae bacterium]
MDGEPLSLTCSPAEAVFLAGLLGADALVGLTDPFAGWLTAEIEKAWETARAALVARQFIAVEADGAITMDIGVATLMSVWVLAEASLLLTCTGQHGSAVTCNYHLTAAMAVEQRVSSDGAVHVAALPAVTALFPRLVEQMRLNGQLAAPGMRAVLTAEALANVRQLAVQEGAAAAGTALRRYRVPEALVRPLADALAAPVVSGALAVLARRQAVWDVAGMGILEGPAGLWRLRSFVGEGEQRVELIPCSAAEARRELLRLINRVSPVTMTDTESEA